MSQTLQEFLVNVKYTIDEPSQQNFFSGLKRVSTAIGGVAAQITAVSVGLVELTRRLSNQGDALYWASQRLNTSIASIQGASAAMSTLGVSAAEAQGAMEKFGAWQRSYGPSATGFLRTLGVTAKDADLQMEQLGNRLAQMASKGPGGYALALQYAQAAGGFNEQQARAMMDPRFAQQNRENERFQAQIWGSGTGGSRDDIRARLKAQTDAYGQASTDMSSRFTQMGLFFQTLTQKFALGLFKAIGPDIDKLNAALLQLQPHIEQIMALVIKHAPDAIQFLIKVIDGLGKFLDMTVKTVEWFQKLPDAVKDFAKTMATMKIGFDLLSSPIARFLLLFTLFMGALDDYQEWKKNQGRPEGEKVETLFDWGGVDSMISTISPMITEFNAWAESTLGIKDAFQWLLGAGIAAWMSGLLSPARLAARAIGRMASAMWGLKAASAAAYAAWLLVLSLKGDTAPLSKEDQEKLDKRNAQELEDYKKSHGGNAPNKDEINNKYGYTGEFWHDTGQMFRNILNSLSDDSVLGKRRISGVKTGTEQYGPPEAGAAAASPQSAATPAERKQIALMEEIRQFMEDTSNWAEKTADGVDQLVEGMGFKDTTGRGGGGGSGVAPAGGGEFGRFLGGGGEEHTNTGDPSAPLVTAPGDYTWGDLGTRANNPGNMNYARGQGAIGRVQYNDATTGKPHTMGVFKTMQEGVSAAYRLLLSNQQRFGKTIAGAFHKYAERPYFNDLARSMGVDPNAPFDLNTADPKIVARMMHEGFKREGRRGSHSVTFDQTLEGINSVRTPREPRGSTTSSNVSGDKNVTVNNHTNVSVSSPDPNMAGRKVAGELNRVHDFQTRHAQSRLV